MRVIVTGAAGLIGSETVAHYDRLGHDVIGIDNNARRSFFGAEGDVNWNLERLLEQTRHFRNLAVDIRDRAAVFSLFREICPEVVVHCAAQPSHDWAQDHPLDDFDVNAVGTANILEATRQFAPEAAFLHMSTNKVYGDAPNELPRVELEKRYDYAREDDYWGISEACRIDQCLHSIFGASKTAADVLAQEYGRYYGLGVGVFRGGCLTGPQHSGVKLHGFLSYLVRVAVANEPYTIIGYKGKQVRDQVHSTDLVSAIAAFCENPRPGEVYNMGGGRASNGSILECIGKVEALLGRRMRVEYCDEARKGDHICYISDVRRFQDHYPEWRLTYTFDDIIEEMVRAEVDRLREPQQ